MFGGGKTAMLAYIGPTYLLRKAGLNKGDYEELFANNPLNGCRAMFFQQADACGAGTIMMSLPSVKKSIDTDNVRLIAEGEPINHLAWAVRGGIGESLKERIQSTLSSLDETEAGKKVLSKARLTGLLVASDGDYDAHRELIADVLKEAY
jgi:phosphonate transport system substrate-binding protein